MIYKQFQDLQLSALGMGAMRLPVIGGDDAKIDQLAVDRMVDVAMERGINYYDTAWGYHSGSSEIAIGRSLGRIRVSAGILQPSSRAMTFLI